MVIPQNAIPTHYSPSPPSSDSDDDSSPREAVPLVNESVPAEQENAPNPKKMNCHRMVVSITTNSDKISNAHY